MSYLGEGGGDVRARRDIARKFWSFRVDDKIQLLEEEMQIEWGCSLMEGGAG